MLLFEELSDFLNKNNLKVINDISNITWKSKLKLKCNICNEEFEITIKQFLRPHPERSTPYVCPACISKYKFENALEKLYGKNPYEIITKKIKSYNDQIIVKCKDCGSEFETKARTLLFSAGLPAGAHPCKQCTKNRRNEKKDINEFYALLKEKFGEINYEILEPEKYSGIFSKEKFKIKCKLCGHIMNTCLNNILNPKNGKHYCRVCNKKDRLLESMSYKERCLQTTGGKIEPIEDYINAKTPIKHKCNICEYGSNGEWEKIPVKNTTRNSGCPKCSKITTQSKAEILILKYIKSIYSGPIIEKDRTILDGKEIDIYIPDKKLGIEIDGLYWHSDKYKDKNYHIEKTLECNKKGIRLVHIFDDEWYQKEDIVKEKLKAILGVIKSEKIYARKCKIKSITVKEKNMFLEKYHIQGKDLANIMEGLFYNDELVAVMTFCKPRLCLGSKKDKEISGEYELSRFATSKHVIGGFSKLLSNILSTHPEILSVKTYADIRWSSLSSNLYTKNGFTQLHISEPNYWYFNKTLDATSATRIHRFNFRKQQLKKKFPDIFSDSLTEKQIMDKSNYGRIYDCGNLVYIFKR